MSDEKQNTKHQTLDEFDFLRIHQFFIAEFMRLRKIEQNIALIFKHGALSDLPRLFRL